MRYQVVSALLLSAFASAQDSTPTWLSGANHGDIVLQLTRYHDYWRYDYEIQQVAAAGMEFLKTRVREAKKEEKLAAVFDIDETALSNWFQMQDCGFCSYLTQAKDYPTTKDPAIQPVLELYKLAKALGVKTFFITGRTEGQRAFTAANLTEVGYEGWVELIMKPDGSKDSAMVFKPAKRQAIVNHGYTIVLNIGDQTSDLAGCCAERSFKLPNPFYLVP